MVTMAGTSATASAGLAARNNAVAGKQTVLSVKNLCKTFTLHLRGGTTLSVIDDANFELGAGECVALTGPSGTGKSSVLKMIYGSYRADSGSIFLHGENDTDKPLDICQASDRELLLLRQTRMTIVSQFLRVLPRISSLDLVCEPAVKTGVPDALAQSMAEKLLQQLNMSSQLWQLPPATFSGGEQQRVNIARGFIGSHSLLLLDEPTASLDENNRDIVIDLVREKKAQGTAVLGIFHDPFVRQAIADREVDVSRFIDL